MSRLAEIALALIGAVVVFGITLVVGHNSVLVSVLAALAFATTWVVTGIILRKRGKT